MKILMIFIDMLRPNLLHMIDERQPVREMEKVFQKWGGTLYTNCFTPSPDTPRSNGCLWSGRYPKDNGCDNRLKYPKFFFKEENQDIWAVMKDAGYTFNVYMHPATKVIGELPPCMEDCGNFSNGKTLQEFLTTVEIKENSFTYFCLEDFHAAVTDYFASVNCIPFGDKKIAGALHLIETELDPDLFDLTIILSDHGFRIYKEPMPDYAAQLGKIRSQVFMLTRTKGQREVTTNKKFCSLLDVYPTICKQANLPPRGAIEGVSLMEPAVHLPLIIEDHRTFNAELGQTIEYWGVIDQEGIHCVDSRHNWIGPKLSEEKKQEYEQLLLLKATDYGKNVKMSQIRGFYEDCLVSAPHYFDGEFRKKRYPVGMTIKCAAKIFLRGKKNRRRGGVI